ncbi:MAG: hypothetical protein OEY24_02615 [Candidatus Bathyarchaeota archaeon]|nr:hypothetical protein [Candidatus Bathyarchaeota archaeon]MDH5494583.1 hypothetical protein [Candidatus Bathyarchaeota archaeon]
MINFEDLGAWVSRNRRDIFIVVAWSLVIACVISEIFLLKYVTSARLGPQKIAYTLYDAPSAGLLEILILFVVSLVVPMFISSVEALFYSSVVSLASSFIGGTIVISFYIWYGLGMNVYWQFEWGWEWAVHFGILNVFRIVFPNVLAPCLLAVVIGSFLRSWIREF